MRWMDRALCATRPADWWSTEDGGARLAALLCGVCPVAVECAATAGTPHGVVRAGRAYRDSGEVALLCPCGRPVVTVRASSAECTTCDPPAVRLPAPRTGRRYGRGGVEQFGDEILRLVDEGWTDRAIAVRLGLNRWSVRGVRRRRQINTCAPQSHPRSA